MQSSGKDRKQTPRKGSSDPQPREKKPDRGGEDKGDKKSMQELLRQAEKQQREQQQQ